MAVVGAVLTGLAVNAISKAVGLGTGGLIEENGLYELHKGEIVIPASEAKKLLNEYKKHKGIKTDKFKPKVLKPKQTFKEKKKK
tara:strand:+ start:5017 stop:5268 length:252 start_codon:yes stop_codon:yes gene_type:complete